MPVAPARRYAQNWLKPSQDHREARTMAVTLGAGYYAAGTILGDLSTVTPAAQVWTLTGTGTISGGTYKLQLSGYTGYGGATTGPIAYNGNTAAIQAALDATFGSGLTVVGGGTLPGTPATITAAGDWANRSLPNFAVLSSLTGSGATLTPTISTPGIFGVGGAGSYAHGNTDGTQTAGRKLLLKYDTIVLPDGTHQFVTSEWAEGYNTPYALAYFRGMFRTSELVGWDTTNMLTDALNFQMLVGTVATPTASTSRVRLL